MVNYKDFFEEINRIYMNCPFFLNEIEFQDLPDAFDLCQALENEPDGLTLEEINQKTIDTTFDELSLNFFEDKGVIQKGIIITAIHFKDRVEELDKEEVRYFLCQDEV